MQVNVSSISNVCCDTSKSRNAYRINPDKACFQLYLLLFSLAKRFSLWDSVNICFPYAIFPNFPLEQKQKVIRELQLRSIFVLSAIIVDSLSFNYIFDYRSRVYILILLPITRIHVLLTVCRIYCQIPYVAF